MEEQSKYDHIYKNNLTYPDGQLYGSLCHGSKVLDYLDTLSFNTILDIGCGRGQFAHIMANRGKYVYAIDISSELINQLSNNHNNKLIEFAHGSMDNIPYDRQFDLVTAFEVIEHIPEELLDRSFIELKRVMKSNAIVSIAFHEDIKWNMKLHMTVRDRKWWLNKIMNYFAIKTIVRDEKFGFFLHLQK